MLALLVVQLEPPSNEYSTFRYAVEPEVFETVKSEVFAPPEQLPRACEGDTVMGCGQSTVALADMAVGVNPVKSLLVSEDVYLQVIALPSPTT